MIEWLINNGVVALGFGGYAVTGLFVVLVMLGYFKDKDDSRRDESDGLADTLINRLKQTVEQQQRDITAGQEAQKTMTERFESQQKEIHLLQGQNETYVKILALRDKNTEQVFNEAPSIFAIAKETNARVRQHGEAIESLTKTLENFITTLRPMLIHLAA
jgi:hypothetical protein